MGFLTSLKYNNAMYLEKNKYIVDFIQEKMFIIVDNLSFSRDWSCNVYTVRMRFYKM